MIRDNDLCMNPVAGQVVTVSAPSTDVIDLTKAGDAVDSLYLVVRVAAIVTAAGAATVTFALETDSAVGFATAKVVLLQTAAIGKADLTANTVVIKAKLPVGCKQFLRVYYTVATGPLTEVSAFDAFLVADVPIS